MSATLLHLAAFDADLDAVRALLDAGYDSNAAARLGQTPLLLAAGQGHTEVVRLLLAQGANPNQVTEMGQSPLWVAVAEGHTEVVALLLKHGADPVVADADPVIWRQPSRLKQILQGMRQRRRAVIRALDVRHSQRAPLEQEFQALRNPSEEAPPAEATAKATLLRVAIQSGNVETLRLLLETGYFPQEKPVASALLRAAQENANSVATMRLLLEYGADPNGDGADDKPLKTAIFKQSVPQVQLLLDAGAQVAVGKEHLLVSAVVGGSTEVLAFLWDRGLIAPEEYSGAWRSSANPEIKALIAEKRGIAWWNAVTVGDVNVVREALVAGADIDAANAEEGTALSQAAKRGDVAMMRLLIDAGADVSAGDRFVFKPIYQAVSSGSAEAVRLLIERGAEWRTNPGISTLLATAAYGQHHAVVEVLMELGAKPDVIDAIWLRWDERVEELLAQKGALPTKSPDGTTALMAAARVGNVALVARLLDRGADVNEGEQQWMKPLHSAIRGGQTEVVRLLLERGAVVETNIHEVGNPLFTALREYDVPIARMVFEKGLRWKSLKGMEKDSLLHSLLFHYRLESAEQYARVRKPLKSVEALWNTVRFLIEIGSDIHAVGFQPNPVTIRNGIEASVLETVIDMNAPLDVVEKLIAKGARIQPTEGTRGDAKRKDSLRIAIEREREDIAELLLRSGFDPNAGLDDPSTLQLARERNSDGMVTLLEKFGASDEKRAQMRARQQRQQGAFRRFAIKVGMSGAVADTGATPLSREEQVCEYRKMLEAEVRRNKAATSG